MIRLSTLRSCAARARFDEDGAIGGIELYQSGAPAATCWQAGLAEEFLPWLALARFGDFNFARLRSQLARAHQPPPSRPAGTGQPLEILVAGNIGDQHAAIVDQVRAAHGRDRSIILNIDSAGGPTSIPMVRSRSRRSG